MRRPPIECDCHICSDDSITVCSDEAHRLLQIDYSTVETYPVDGDPSRRAAGSSGDDGQRSITDF